VLAVLPFLFGRATDLTAAIYRIAEIFEVFEELAAQKVETNAKHQRAMAEEISSVEPISSISFENVSVCFPGKSPIGASSSSFIFNNFTFEIKEGQNTVVVGPSGAGKSSLLRVVGGLWDVHSGTDRRISLVQCLSVSASLGRIRRPPTVGKNGLFFVPQKPYITSGTLRDQLIYPLAAGQADVEVAFCIHLRHAQSGQRKTHVLL
jgi:ABC-type uncharacterized transport system fused permease/ATPase subunit